MSLSIYITFLITSNLNHSLSTDEQLKLNFILQSQFWLMIMACEEGKNIRPSTDQQFVRTILDRNYNLNVSKIKELNSYDDRNYYVIASPKSDGSFQQELILKIINSSNSKRRDLIGMQTFEIFMQLTFLINF